MKQELRSWFGQSFADKLVIGAIALSSPLLGWFSNSVSSTVLREALLLASVVAVFSFILLIYFNQRMARMTIYLERNANLLTMLGYILRHQFNVKPRTSLERYIQYADTKDKEQAVVDTLEAHRIEILKMVLEANPDLTKSEVNSLLDVFYGTEQPSNRELT